jgi:hypothetical protein
MMQYYFIYYMNLMFSALSYIDQQKVVNKCLVPLLNLADSGYKFGIQISGVSLEIIQQHRPDLIHKLRCLLENGTIDFIGNGYCQVINPLFPHEVNLQNHKIGLKIYNNILNTQPEICTINEMAFSHSSCESILASKYKTIIMEYNNAKENIGNRQITQFDPARVEVSNEHLNLIWCDTIAFQKFQKYVHGEIGLDEYDIWLRDYTNQKKGTLCLYCSDAEVFGYRPKRYGTEVKPFLDEWTRIRELMERYKNNTIRPSQIKFSSKKPLKLTSSEFPIIVKKQQKYNITRWAITGRNDRDLNAFCYEAIDQLGNQITEAGADDWKDLIKLCSSDLRTHIEEGRWLKASYNMERFKKRFGVSKVLPRQITDNKNQQTNQLLLDKNRGNSIISWPKDNPVVGKADPAVYDDTFLMADFFSGYVVIERLGQHKVSDLDFTSNTSRIDGYSQVNHPDGYVISKSIHSFERNVLEIDVNIHTPRRTREQIKPCTFTLTSENWDRKTLQYEAKLGGSKREIFPFGDKSFDQDSILNLNVVGLNGFFPTDGKFIISDKNKKLQFYINPMLSFCLVRLTYTVTENGDFVLLISFVSQDIDETFRVSEAEQDIRFNCILELVTNDRL